VSLPAHRGCKEQLSSMSELLIVTDHLQTKKILTKEDTD